MWNIAVGVLTYSELADETKEGLVTLALDTEDRFLATANSVGHVKVSTAHGSCCRLGGGHDDGCNDGNGGCAAA